MSPLKERPRTLLHGVVFAIVIALLGACDYYGYAVFGETPDQERPGSTSHFHQRFHK